MQSYWTFTQLLFKNVLVLVPDMVLSLKINLIQYVHSCGDTTAVNHNITEMTAATLISLNCYHGEFKSPYCSQFCGSIVH